MQRGSTVFWETVGKIWETVSVAQTAFKKHWYWAQQSANLYCLSIRSTQWTLRGFSNFPCSLTSPPRDGCSTPALRSAAQSRDNHETVLSDNKNARSCGFKLLCLLECKQGLQRFDISDSAHAHNLLLHIQPTQSARYSWRLSFLACLAENRNVIMAWFY